MLTDDAAYAASAVRELALNARASLAPAKGRHFSTSHSHGDSSALMLNGVFEHFRDALAGDGESYFDRLWQNGSKTQR